MLVKICGITEVEDALAAIEFGADLLGFNFYRKSPRYVSPEKLEKILDEIPPAIGKVGVFVNEAETVVQDYSSLFGLDFLQFHGDELPSYCAQFATPYWKAFRLKDAKSLEMMKKYACEHYVVDAFQPDVFGGTGKVADWNLAAEAKKFGKILLAGGLTPENVAEGIFKVQPDGVDVASGVESSPGRKDIAKLERFITNAKEAIL